MLKDRVKTLRKSKGWSQVRLAKEARVSQQTIGKIETGKAAESRKLPAIAAALGVPVEELTQDQRSEVPQPTSKPQATAPMDLVWLKLEDLWQELDRAAKRQVLRSAENELARIRQLPSRPGRAQRIAKKRRVLPRLATSRIQASSSYSKSS